MLSFSAYRVLRSCVRDVLCGSLVRTGSSRPVLLHRRMQKDAPYHTGGEYKPESTVAKTPIVPVAAHNAYPAVPLAKIEILPAAITISGSHYDQRLVVEGTYTDGHQEDLTPQATFAISNPKVARITNDFAIAQGDGQGTVTATVHGHRASVPVRVENFTAPAGWSFRNDVQPVLTKMGCNSGPVSWRRGREERLQADAARVRCRNRLLTLTHQALARRTERIEPAKSLILVEANSYHRPWRRQTLCR